MHGTTARHDMVDLGQTGAADAVRLFVAEFGDAAAPPVVLLHGGASRAGTWTALAVALAADGHRVIAPDLRGHGRSSRTRDYPLAGYRDDVARLLDARGLERVALVGHSLGGYVAIALAHQQPRRVTRLVLEEPPAPPRDQPLMVASGRQRLLLALGSLDPRRRYHRRALLSAIAQLRRPDPGWWGRLPSVTAPTLVLSGGPTSHLPPARLAELAEALPDGRFVTIPVGHRIHSRAPERFRDAVLPFLAGR